MPVAADWEPGIIGKVRRLGNLLRCLAWCVNYSRCGKDSRWLVNPVDHKTLRIYADADAVLGVAGGLIQDYSGPPSPLLHLHQLALPLLVGTPLFLLPQSIGPLRTRLARKFTQWVLQRAALVLVREPISLQTALSLGVAPEKVVLSGDLTFLMQSADKEICYPYLNQIGIDAQAPLAGLSIMGWKYHSRRPEFGQSYFDAMVAVGRYVVDTLGLQLCLLPFDRRCDVAVTERLKEAIGERATIFDTSLPPPIVRGAFDYFDLCIGTRTHSNIFALIAGVPLVAISHVQKMTGTMEMLQLEDCMLPIEQVTADSLIERVQYVWDHQDELRNRIGDSVKKVQDITECALDRLALEITTTTGA